MSLKDLRAKSDAALTDIGQQPRGASSLPQRPATGPGAMAFMQPTIDALNDRAEKAESRAADVEAQLARQPTEVPVSQLEEASGRRRHLTPEQFEELKENLRNNPLVHPVAVRRLSKDKYEVVSGHHRVAAFKALGRTHVPVVVSEINEDASADRMAFYANLLQPALPDYEKYLGFRGERDRTGLSAAELARKAGVPKSVISMLFTFEQLPAQALDLITQRPEVIGMSTVAELVRISGEDASARVTEAVRGLVQGRFTQKEAIAYARRPTLAPSLTPSIIPKPVKVRAGRLEYCQYLGRGNTLRVEFKSEVERQRAEAIIANTLQDLAKTAENS